MRKTTIYHQNGQIQAITEGDFGEQLEVYIESRSTKSKTVKSKKRLSFLKSSQVEPSTSGVNVKKTKKVARQKGGDLTQSYDKSPYINRNVKGTK